MVEALRAYDIENDRNKGFEINSLAPEERMVKQEKLASYLSFQMETHLGERFNVVISEYGYDIKNGEIWGKDMGEPFLQSLERGRDFRKTNGQVVDQRREEAEVEGFRKMQEVLVDESTPIGTMMLSISPPGLEGSSYLHNFYDILTVKEENSERLIVAKRIASSLTPEEYKEKIGAFTEIKVDETDIAASFLENPICIENTLTSEDLQYYLQKDHGFMEKEELERIVGGCNSVIEAYSRAIIEQPGNDYLHKVLFDTVLNKADALSNREDDNLEEFSFFTLKDDVARYAGRPVREVMTGCGFSGGYEVSKNQMSSPFSVLTYAQDKYGERTFACPNCKKENIRPFNMLLLRCTHCNSDKVRC